MSIYIHVTEDQRKQAVRESSFWFCSAVGRRTLAGYKTPATEYNYLLTSLILASRAEEKRLPVKQEILPWLGTCATCSRSDGGRRGGNMWLPTHPGVADGLSRRCSPGNRPTWPKPSPARRASAQLPRRLYWLPRICRHGEREKEINFSTVWSACGHLCKYNAISPIWKW